MIRITYNTTLQGYGIFDDDNIKYYKTYDKSKYLKTNIQFILHWADWMSTTIERDQEIKAPF